jgi:general secretion pathway protein M
VRLNREQMICIGSFCLLLMACAFAVGASLQARSDAGQELAERRDALSHLQTRVRSALDGRSRKGGGAAPPLAFLDAATPGLAAAQLQSYLSQVIASHNATLISYGTEPTHREDSSETVRAQAVLDVGQKALQELLYDLESRTPYAFVEVMAVQPPSTTALRATQEPVLRLTLGLRALWRRGAA